MLQLIIATVLFMVMTFGIGFILNMLLKTTWFPTYLFIVVIIITAFVAPWAGDNTLLIDNISKYTIVDFIPVIGAIAGAYISGSAIKALRKSGFKMF